MTKAKILIVEDEGIVAKNIQVMLTDLGYGISEFVLSGEAAVKKAEEMQPDLILMDIKIKGDLDGIKTAKKIQELFDTPIVFLTAYMDEATLKRAKMIEPYGYLLKPIGEKELYTTIEIALYKSKMLRELKEREHWVSTVLKSIGDSVITVNKEGQITFLNPAAEFLTRWKHKEALGKDLFERLNIITDENENHRVEKLDRKRMVKSDNYIDEAILVDSKGVEKPVEYSEAPIIDDRRKIRGNVLILRDITEKKNYEKKLKQGMEYLRKYMEGSIQAISKIVEMKDSYTSGHQKRVARLSLVIAKEMGFEEERIEGLRMAAEIHDIGKIQLPSDLLSKPNKLSELEMSIIKTHSKAGYDILKKIKFPYPIADIVHQHHERMDGSGYPLGLSGERILLEARIIAVADVVEAMSSHRPYRPALGIDKALEEISKKKGILYDSTVADACLRLFSKKHLKLEELFKPAVPLG